MEERLPSFKEIVEDETFIRWVKNNSWQDANDWEEKIRQNPEMMEDTAAAKKLIEHFSSNDSPIEKTYLDGIWNNVDKATTEKGRIRPFRSIYLYAASAAAVLIFLVIGLLPQIETFKTDNAEIIINLLKKVFEKQEFNEVYLRKMFAKDYVQYSDGKKLG